MGHQPLGTEIKMLKTHLVISSWHLWREGTPNDMSIIEAKTCLSFSCWVFPFVKTSQMAAQYVYLLPLSGNSPGNLGSKGV